MISVNSIEAEISQKHTGTVHAGATRMATLAHAQKLRPIEVKLARIAVLRLVGVPDLGENMESDGA